MRRCMRLLFAASLLGLLAPVFPVGVALADDATVSGLCLEADFDAALAAAQSNGGGTITFDCGEVTTIDFTGVKTIAAPNVVVIDGGGAMHLIGQGLTQLFTVEEGATLELRGIGLVAGNAPAGGAAFNAGTLRIVNSLLANNTATDPNSGGGAVLNADTGTLEIIDSQFVGNTALAGGAIISVGALTMTGSLLAGNSGGVFGGALLVLGGEATVQASTFSDNFAVFGGAIANIGTLNLSASTLYRNTGPNGAGGGGIYNLGDLTVTNSTLSGNAADAGTAILNLGTGVARLFSSTVTQNGPEETEGASLDNSQAIGEGAIILRQTIVANQRGGADCAGVITSQGHNLDSDESCELDAAGDISGGNASLMSLQDNGGLTLTHMPNLDSDAVDAGGASCSKTDQRGFYRPVGPACDIGAVELSNSTFPLCANRYTGVVTSLASGQCPPTSSVIDTIVQDSLTFCTNRYTGELTFRPRGNCAPSLSPHGLPNDGDLLTCVNNYTGKHRQVTDHARCTPVERPNLILAADVI